MNKRLLLASLLFLSACGLAGPRQGSLWYVLEDQAKPAAPPMAGAQRTWSGTLLVRETEAPGFYQNNALAFSRAPGTRGHYQYARQPELPALRVATLMRQRLEKSGLFQAVSSPGSGVDGQYQLNTRLLDLYHDATQAPGDVHLVLEVELVQRGDARQLARTRIETRAPAPSNDAPGAALASNLALTQALDQLTTWLEQLPRSLSDFGRR